MTGDRAPGQFAGRTWLWIALFAVTLPLVNPYVRGDGNGYYAYVRSAIIDGDLDFENEFRQGDPSFRSYYFDADGTLRPDLRSRTGRVVNQWAVGPALLWLPFFLAAHAAVGVVNLFGAGLPADGFSPVYRWACAIGTAIYGALALALAARVAATLTTRRAAAIGALGIWWASSLPVYMYFVPFHVHALSAFAVAVYLWCWLRWRPLEARRGRWLLWGAAAGLMIEVYHLNALFLLIAAWEWTRDATRRRDGRDAWRSGAAFATGLVAALVPHAAVKWIVHGSPFMTGYLDEFIWEAPRLWQVGFSADHGLFVWTPVVAAAVAGLLLWWRAEPAVGRALTATFALFYYVVASYQNWHGLSSFGNRFFLSFTFVFVVGLALCVAGVERAGARRLARAVVPAVAVAIVWNLGFMYQWGANIVPSRGPVDFRDVARNQVTVVPQHLGGFLWRYLTDRGALTRDVERQDDVERRNYDHKR